MSSERDDLRAAFLAANGFGAASRQPLSGDASTRLYERLRLLDGTRLIFMDQPPVLETPFCPPGAGPAQRSALGYNAANRLAAGSVAAFVATAAYLRGLGLSAPKVLAHDVEAGLAVLEDLGDDTLANYLLREPEQQRAIYTRAVTDLARAQRALDPLPVESIVRTRAFDEDLLRWEIDHFREWGLEARGHVLTTEDRNTFDAIAARLATRIAGWPKGFVHRDYQSRNLMVREGGALAWIDFQDALLGPRIYDMVALLNDSYQTFDRAFVEERLSEYAESTGMSQAEKDALGVEFDLMTVQRKLKDAGRFVFIDRVKGNSAFLKFVVPTVAKVASSLARLRDVDPDMAALEALLIRLLPHEMTAI